MVHHSDKVLEWLGEIGDRALALAKLGKFPESGLLISMEHLDEGERLQARRAILESGYWLASAGEDRVYRMGLSVQQRYCGEK